MTKYAEHYPQTTDCLQIEFDNGNLVLIYSTTRSRKKDSKLIKTTLIHIWKRSINPLIMCSMNYANTRINPRDLMSNLNVILIKQSNITPIIFHNHQSQWHPIPYCISKQEYDDAHSLFTFDRIKQFVSTTNANKSSGDNIPAKALKYLSDDGIKILQSIYIQSYLEAAVPRQWQNSSIVEVFKSGDILDPGRFRPICLISIAFKIYQQILYYSYFRSLLLAGHRQHGKEVDNDTTENSIGQDI